jgi:hypothetical protein
MSNIVIVIERKRADQEHWVKPAPKTGNTEQQYRVFFEGEEIGSWRIPEHEAARWLLAQGKAQRSDTLRTRRRVNDAETPSMKGSVGWFADHTIRESDSQGGTPRLAKWKPMPEGVRDLTPKGVDG